VPLFGGEAKQETPHLVDAMAHPLGDGERRSRLPPLDVPDHVLMLLAELGEPPQSGGGRKRRGGQRIAGVHGRLADIPGELAAGEAAPLAQ